LETLIQQPSNTYVITSQHISKTSGVHHIYLRQAINGLEVAGTESSVHLNKNDEPIVVHNKFIENIGATVIGNTQNLDARAAVESVALQMDYTLAELQETNKSSSNKDTFLFNGAGISGEDIPVKLMYYYQEGIGTRLIWELSVQETATSDWWNFRVDAGTGAIIDKDNWTVYCQWESSNTEHEGTQTMVDLESFNLFNESPSMAVALAGTYNVFPLPIESPSHGSRSLISNPEDLNASPFGWHDTDGSAGAEFTYTRGNNVLAQEDVNGNNGTGTRADGGAGLNFNFSLDLTQQPINYQNAALTNLFFWNNLMHDITYQYGFDESGGNFQQNNYGNGGTGNDYVLADAQDGSGTNNANFGTPSDGSRPRMQMFLWDPAPPIITFTVNAPVALAGNYNAVQASFGTDVPTTPITTDFVLYDDNAGGDDHDACEAAVNGGSMSGKIVIIRRGSCAFVDKVVRAENEGAAAVIMVNNVSGSPITMGGTDPGIGIPSVMVSQTDGEAIITALLAATTVNGTLVGTAAGTVNLDGDLDNGIIAHEYGHGISNRLTGGPSNVNCLNNAEQMGEGWSDFWSLMLTMQSGDTRTDAKGIGTYAIGQAPTGGGIRPAPYSTDFTVNDYTYDDTNDTAGISQPHGIGFVWCTMLWEMTWDLIDKYGFDPDIYYGSGGNNIAMKLVVEGMKMQSCSPGFVDGRDGILAADLALYGGAHQCLIWEAFARRGLGASASQGSTSSRGDQTEAFDLPSTTYNGSWSNGVPALGKIAIFNANYNTTSGDIEACSCTINSGRTVTVSPGDYMLIEEDITVNGSLIVEHQGNVVQINDDAAVTNNGTINVNLTTPNLASRDFMVLGSPMSADTRTGVWNAAFLVLNHLTANFVPNPAVAAAFPGAENFADDNYDNWVPYSGGINVGEGYIVRPQSGYGQPGGIFNYTYNQGTLNNGVVNFNVIYNTPGPLPADNKNASPNVLANPYASAMDADAFINANSMVDELYFWEHLTPPSSTLPGAGAMNFDMQDISMYNLIGGTPAANDPGTSTTPNGIISTGQGFGIKANAAGTAVFNNSMRLTSGNTTLRNPASGERDRIWLKVVQPQNEVQSIALIGFTDEATSGLDSGFDSRCLATIVGLYSHLNDGSQQLGIQTREAFESGMRVPMGFSTQLTEALPYKISIENIDGQNIAASKVYLVDNETQSVTDLTTDSYSFVVSEGTYHNRFLLIFESPTILGTSNQSLDQLVVFPNPTNDVLNILSPNTMIEKVTVYDIQGRVVATQAIGANTAHVDLSQLKTAMYLVSVETEAGTVTKRIVKQ